MKMKKIIFERLLPSIAPISIKSVSDLSGVDIENMDKAQYAATWLSNTKIDGVDAASEVIRLLCPPSEFPKYVDREWAKFRLKKLLPELYPNLGNSPRL